MEVSSERFVAIVKLVFEDEIDIENGLGEGEKQTGRENLHDILGPPSTEGRSERETSSRKKSELLWQARLGMKGDD